MSVTILNPQPDTAHRRLQSVEAASRPGHRVAGGWIDDIVALRQAVFLCEFCNPKFNPKSRNYELWRRDVWSHARCDGCGQMSLHARVFIHEATHETVGEWERRPVRRGRWAK